MRCKLLPACYVATPRIGELRRLLRYRSLVVSEAVRRKNKMAGLRMETGALSVKVKLHRKKYFASLLAVDKSGQAFHLCMPSEGPTSPTEAPHPSFETLLLPVLRRPPPPLDSYFVMDVPGFQERKDGAPSVSACKIIKGGQFFRHSSVLASD